MKTIYILQTSHRLRLQRHTIHKSTSITLAAPTAAHPAPAVVVVVGGGDGVGVRAAVVVVDTACQKKAGQSPVRARYNSAAHMSGSSHRR